VLQCQGVSSCEESAKLRSQHTTPKERDTDEHFALERCLTGVKGLLFELCEVTILALGKERDSCHVLKRIDQPEPEFHEQPDGDAYFLPRQEEKALGLRPPQRLQLRGDPPSYHQRRAEGEETGWKKQSPMQELVPGQFDLEKRWHTELDQAKHCGEKGQTELLLQQAMLVNRVPAPRS